MATNTRKQQSSRPAPEEEGLEPARTQGMLMEVNWRERTAQLHPTRPFPGERHVPLRFPPALDAEMLRHATRFVMLAGRARYAENDDCTLFVVEEVIPSRGSKPFSREELEEALAKAKPFVPGEIPPMDIPEEEMKEFIRVILEARDRG